MEQALKPEAQGNVAVEPVADLIARLTYRVNNPSAWDSFDDGASELIREAASSIASLSERLAEANGRAYHAEIFIRDVDKLRMAAEQECDELRAKLAEAREIIEPFADADAGMPTDAGEQDQVMFVCQMKDGRQATFAWARPAAFRRARAFRDATLSQER